MAKGAPNFIARLVAPIRSPSVCEPEWGELEVFPIIGRSEELLTQLLERTIISIGYRPLEDVTDLGWFQPIGRVSSTLGGLSFNSSQSWTLKFELSLSQFTWIETNTIADLIGSVQISNNLVARFHGGKPQGKVYIDEWAKAFEKADTVLSTKNKPEQPGSIIPNSENILNTPTYGDHSKEVKGITFFDFIKPWLMPPLESFDYEWTGFLQPDKKPRPYQNEGIKKLVENEGFLLADEMGTGKTVMAVVALRMLMRKSIIKKALILCPVSLLRVWEDHLRDWSMGELRVVRPYGPRRHREINWKMHAHVYVTTYDTFRSDYDSGLIDESLLDSNLLILDEAQYIKNQRSSRFKAIQRFKKQRAWALTGTPIENSIEDIKSIFSIIRPGVISSEVTDPNRLKELIAPLMLRRLKKDVLKDLPPKTNQELWLTLTDEQQDEYNRWLAQARTKLKEEYQGGNPAIRIHILQVIQKLKQICNFSERNSKSAKLNAVINLVEEAISSENKVLIFSQFKGSGIFKLQKALETYGLSVLTGDMSMAQRNTNIEKFRHNDETRIFLISVRAGGIGLTLTEASYVIHFDHWWNPAVMRQAEDRVHRLGQEKPVNVYELWIENTIEEKIKLILAKKLSLANEVIDGLADDFLGELSIEELLHDVFEIEDIPIHRKSEIVRQPQFRVTRPTNIMEARNRLMGMSPAEFEKIVAQLYSRLGYQKVEHMGRTGDGGVDILATRFDQNGTRITVTIQCKRYRHSVGVSHARNVIGTVEDKKHDKGILVTTSDFTNDAKQLAARNARKLELVNGEKLVSELLRFGILE